MASDLDRLRAKPAHRDKSLGAALGAALAIISATRDADTAVATAGVIGASIIVSVAVGGRYVLRGNAVAAAGSVLTTEGYEPLPIVDAGDLPVDEIQQILKAHAAERSDRSAGATVEALDEDDGSAFGPGKVGDV